MRVPATDIERARRTVNACASIWTSRGLLALLVALAAGCARLALPPGDVPLRAPDGYYPGADWRTATPEAQGIDSEALIALFDTVASERLPIHVPARVVWTRFCMSGSLAHGIRLTDFQG